MSELADSLDGIANKILANFQAKDAAREKALPLCRETIRYCSQSIRAIHRQEFDKAAEMLLTAQELVSEAGNSLSVYSELKHHRFLLDAQKEFAEGRTTLALITKQKLPTPQELAVEDSAYLNGLGEAVGELRRYILDGLRKGDFSRGEELLQAMDDVYDVLVTMDFPDAITGSLRRTTDMVRAVLERTRSDLTLTIQQKSLEDKIKEIK